MFLSLGLRRNSPGDHRGSDDKDQKKCDLANGTQKAQGGFGAKILIKDRVSARGDEKIAHKSGWKKTQANNEQILSLYQCGSP